MQKRQKKFAKPAVERHEEVRKAFHSVIKRQGVSTDLYSHKCPGNKKIFKPEVTPVIIDLGETKSIIEGETSMEIPLCWVKRVSSGLKMELESVTLSDIRERERALLPYNERIAHTHFPKEFFTVQVIGPTIPAALTITKIRSEREYKVETDVQLQPKTNKAGKKTEKKQTEKETRDVVTEEAELDLPAGTPSDEEEKKEEIESIEVDIFEEDEQSEQRLSEVEETISVEGEIEEKEISVSFSSENNEQDETQPESKELEMEN